LSTDNNETIERSWFPSESLVQVTQFRPSRSSLPVTAYCLQYCNPGAECLPRSTVLWRTFPHCICDEGRSVTTAPIINTCAMLTSLALVLVGAANQSVQIPHGQYYPGIIQISTLVSHYLFALSFPAVQRGAQPPGRPSVPSEIVCQVVPIPCPPICLSVHASSFCLPNNVSVNCSL
jgi:hypothetical protein